MIRLVVLMLICLQAHAIESIPFVMVNAETQGDIDLSSPLGIPATSHTTAGKVTPKKIESTFFHSPIFVIGADRFSRDWLKQNQKQLQSMNAVGFITNVDSIETVIHLQEQSKLPLLPVNVDPLMKFIRVKHYPIAIAGGEVWQ